MPKNAQNLSSERNLEAVVVGKCHIIVRLFVVRVIAQIQSRLALRIERGRWRLVAASENRDALISYDLSQSILTFCIQ